MQTIDKVKNRITKKLKTSLKGKTPSQLLASKELLQEIDNQIKSLTPEELRKFDKEMRQETLQNKENREILNAS